jgi:hypothetical protein
LNDDGFTEHNAAQYVADRAVGRFPHVLQFEFFNACFVGRNGGALDGHTVLFGRVGRIDRDLIVSLIALFDAEVIIFEVNIKIRQDQLFANPLPDDAGHLIAVHFNDGCFYLDFCHVCFLSREVI